jgi:hypothetical protein
MAERDDDELTRQVAADYVAEHGPAVVDLLRSLEAIERGKGNHAAADVWRDIAQAAADLVRTTSH